MRLLSSSSSSFTRRLDRFCFLRFFLWWLKSTCSSSSGCRLPLPLILFLLLSVLARSQQQPRIAIIGGGVSGSFTAKYLVDWDPHCLLESITVFEAVPIPLQGPLTASSSNSITAVDVDSSGQGSRVQTLQLQKKIDFNATSNSNDNPYILVELGASIGFKEFHLVLDMIRNDPDLKIGLPHSEQDDESSSSSSLLPRRQGMGIYNGRRKGGAQQQQDRSSSASSSDEWSLNTATQSYSFLRKWMVLWRYGWELPKITRVCQQMLRQFAKLPGLLDDHTNGNNFFESPTDVWKAIHMDQLVQTSFDALLDAILGLPRELPWWRQQLLRHGNIRSELLTAINLNNYNQDNSQVNAIVGLGSYAATVAGGLFSIVGGNIRLIASAMNQANQKRKEQQQQQHSSCGQKTPWIQQVPKRVTTVIGMSLAASSSSGTDAGGPLTFELFSADQESLGMFDIVVLAAPMQQARIDFFVQSQMDASVLQPMPLGHQSVIDPETQRQDQEQQQEHEGHVQFPPALDPASQRRYTQVVTTVVSNATTLNLHHDGKSPDSDSTPLPRSILMTLQGKRSLFNITTISQLDNGSSGIYKLFSDERLSLEILEQIFGPHVVVEYVKEWGGTYGGATPDYRGTGTSETFLLYDGARGLEGYSSSSSAIGGAIYYPNAMEQSSLACMEIAAIGAKAVAKLIARRLGLLVPDPQFANSDKPVDEL